MSEKQDKAVSGANAEESPTPGPNPPIAPGFPLPAPVPIPGCEVCAAYVVAIDGKKRAGELSAMTDCRVLMGRHIEAEHP